MEFDNIFPHSQEQIRQILPHGRRFLFIDQIIDVEYGKRAVGMLADLTRPEYDWMQDHFPSFVVVPGAILMEALAEVGGIAILGMPENKGKIALLTGSDKLRWREPVLPDDRVRLEVVITRLRTHSGRGDGSAILERSQKIVHEGTLHFHLQNKQSS